MNTFNVTINTEAGWLPIDGEPVFPLSYSNLLDERLDEGALTLYKSRTKTFPINGEIAIECGGKSTFWRIAGDSAVEYPNGSGVYKHSLQIIEETKWLEGFVCQSITFTNTKGNLGAVEDAAQVDPMVYEEGEPAEGRVNNFPGVPGIVSPVLIGTECVLPSLGEIAGEMLPYVKGGSYIVTDGTSLTIRNGEETTVYTTQTAEDFTARRTVTSVGAVVQVEYYVRFSWENLPPTDYNVVFYIAGVAEQDPAKSWTITDCVNRVLDLAEPLFGNDEPRFIFDPAQALKYSYIPAPEFAMTQATLREQLQTIGGRIHAEPYLVTVNGEKVIRYKPYGETTEANITAPYVYHQADLDINNYCTDVHTNASNLVNRLNTVQGVIAEPYGIAADMGYKTVRAEYSNVRIEDTNARATTGLPVYDVTEVWCGVFTNAGEWEIEPVNITDYVYEKSGYDLLSSFGGAVGRSKQYALYYTQGAKNIDGLFFKPASVLNPALKDYAIINILAVASGRTPNGVASFFEALLDPDNKSGEVAYIAFHIRYVPQYSGMFAHGKQTYSTADKFTKIYNQGANVIETSYYGEHIKGVAARLGNVELTKTYIFKSLNQVPQVGTMLDGYAISAVSVEVMPYYIKCTVALTKDFNRISQYVGISSNKRVYEVSEKQAYQRDILLREKLVVSTTPMQSDANTLLIETSAVREQFLPLASRTKLPISCALAWYENEAGDEGAKCLLPVVSSSFGNAMLFSWGYQDNYSAGDQAEYYTGEVKGFWNKAAPYSDFYGRAHKYRFALMDSPKQMIPGNQGAPPALGIAQNLPAFPYGRYTELGIISTANGAYLLRKDSREILSFNYELEFQSADDSIIIGSGLAATNPLVEGGTRQTVLTNLMTERAFLDGGVYENATMHQGPISGKIPYVPGHIIYARADVSSTGGDMNIGVRYWNSSNMWLGQDLAEVVGGRASVVSSMDNVAAVGMDFFIPNMENVTVATIQYSKCVWVDLTACFGAGNEPTKEWCDANIPFFGGTYALKRGREEAPKVFFFTEKQSKFTTTIAGLDVAAQPVAMPESNVQSDGIVLPSVNVNCAAWAIAYDYTQEIAADGRVTYKGGEVLLLCNEPYDAWKAKKLYFSIQK